ncbi:type VII secretion target [Amycolatopsis pittospori]|uniref:type VII secretion target n=1 Tax=Amycolatopsis pittospori TaxID=2749434 RepID=UPI0015F0AB48|nr:type VII secretion target [Amycolatopsis pittospori]
MSGPGYGVSPEGLKAHADQVADLAARIRKASAAADQVGMGGFAGYGLLCAVPVGGVLQLAQGDNDELMTSAANLGDALSDALKKAATDYTKIDDDAAQLNRDLGKKL